MRLWTTWASGIDQIGDEQGNQPTKAVIFPHCANRDASANAMKNPEGPAEEERRWDNDDLQLLLDDMDRLVSEHFRLNPNSSLQFNYRLRGFAQYIGCRKNMHQNSMIHGET